MIVAPVSDALCSGVASWRPVLPCISVRRVVGSCGRCTCNFIGNVTPFSRPGGVIAVQWVWG